MLEAIFAPQSVATAGASPEPSKRGYYVLRYVVQNGYAFSDHHHWDCAPGYTRPPLNPRLPGAERYSPRSSYYLIRNVTHQCDASP
jgi:hypothetical protein